MISRSVWQMVVDKGVLTADQLKQYRTEAAQEKKLLYRFLVDGKKIDAQQLAQIYADYFGYPYCAAISDDMADPQILLKVPMNFLRENILIPLKTHTKVVIVVADPTNLQPLDEMKLVYGSDVEIVVSTESTIVNALNHYYPLEGGDEMIEDLEEEADMSEVSFGEIDEKDIMSGANEAPIIKLVNYILFQAVKMNASDIHIEPAEKEVRVRYRIDGIMHLSMVPPKRIQNALISRVKIMSGANIAEKRKPQDARIEIKVADKAYDIRVSILPAKHGESIVMRLLDKEKGFVLLEKMGFSDRDLRTVQAMASKPNGIILVSGPTGSGKTTTLYSILHKLNEPTVNIITVEDPVEYQMAGVTQVQVNEKVELTFAAALRAILRQDPDIIMIGEMRDHETSQIAIQSALTGHLVLSTIHTNSAPATITRLIDMGIEPFLIASSIEGIIAQRLVRKLCADCRQSYTPTPEILKSLGVEKFDEKVTFYKPVGCQNCNNLGYRGRLAVYEVMVMTEEFARLTIERASTDVLRHQATKDGMTLLVQDGVEKIKLGLTSVEEVLSVASAYTQID